eukprot:154762_1
MNIFHRSSISRQISTTFRDSRKLTISKSKTTFQCDIANTKERKRLSSVMKKSVLWLIQFLFCLIFIWYLNMYGQDILIKLVVQLTIGTDSNIFNSHQYYKYITPNATLKQCYDSYYQPTKQCNKLRNDALKIPKIIHQTYRSLDSIPLRWNNTANIWRKYHPDWTYMFWSDNDAEAFMNKYYYSYNKNILNSYRHKISKVDAWKYFILYHYGGIYADMDIIPTTNIEPLLSNNDHLLVETPNIGLTNALIASCRHSKLMEYAIKHLNEYINPWYNFIIPEHVRILYTAGPTFFWMITLRFLYDNSYTNVSVMDNKYYNKLGDCDCLNVNMNTAYFNHLEGKTWHLDNSWIISIYFHCHFILIFGGMAIILFFVYRFVYLIKQCNICYEFY